MKFIILIICLISQIQIFGQSPCDSLFGIYWHCKKLNCEDFKGKNKVMNDTLFGFYSINIYPKPKLGFCLMIAAEFSPEFSYLVGKCDSLNLNHQQLQFDIMECYARKFRKDFLSKYKESKDVKTEVLHATNQKFFLEALRMIERCNKKTHFGKKIASENKWKRKIQKRILRLNKYSDPILCMKISDEN